MTPLARALNALERLNARAARPDRQRDPSEPRAGGTSATEGDAGSDGGYDATERAWWGAGPQDDAEPETLVDVLAGMSGTQLVIDAQCDALKAVIANMAADLLAKNATIDKQNATNSRLTAEVKRLDEDWQRESNARDQDFADYTLAIDKLTGQRDEQAALIGRMTATLDKARAEVTQLAVELVAKDDAMLTAMRNLIANDATIVRLTADLASRTGDLDDAEARCERLWLQLQEAANVPDVSEIPWDVQAAFERRAL